MLDILHAALTDGHPSARILLIAAHPDDETLGAGSRLFSFAPGSTIVHVTDGAPREMSDALSHGFPHWWEYAAARRTELRTALAAGQAEHLRLVELNIPDQDAARNLRQIANEIRALIEELRPVLVLTHPFEGGHPDHDAVAFAAAQAVRSGVEQPLLAEFASYHRDPDTGGIRTARFLHSEGDELVLPLSAQEADRKRRMLECFVTQRETLAPFRPDVPERFRLAPAYDFSRPPHDGPLYYEGFPWGLTAAEFCELALAAA